VNAFTYTFFDRAIEQAKAAESRYLTGHNLRPLEGIPVVIKDLHPVKGEITTCGSRVLEGVRADYTAPSVQRLFDAGAIMHARSTTPEYAHAGYTYSALWGVTRNPWNLDYAPGGSSGGAGAAVASGMTAIADGTDGGGSIRIPASACGIVGYKPPFGRNPLNVIPTLGRIEPFHGICRHLSLLRLSIAVASGRQARRRCDLCWIRFLGWILRGPSRMNLRQTEL
jgi:Asp-tRNA(Asn)/Glu-tRNA(Gln) amidotransferase A subunit family amidase